MKENWLIKIVFMVLILCFLAGCNDIKNTKDTLVNKNEAENLEKNTNMSEMVVSNNIQKNNSIDDEITETEKKLQEDTNITALSIGDSTEKETLTDENKTEETIEKQENFETEQSEKEKIYLDEMNIDELFKQFLYGDLAIINPFSEEVDFLYAFGWETKYDYWGSQEGEDYKCTRKFALVDLDGDGKEELIFSAGEYKYLDEVILLLHSDGKQLYCWDIYETHTQHIETSIYTNGIVKWGQNHTGAEEVYGRYDELGNFYELISFSSSVDYKGESFADESDYEYYYLNGDRDKPYSFKVKSYEEYEEFINNYIGKLEPITWFNCDNIVDIIDIIKQNEDL